MILSSGSPRRRELLRRMGFSDFRVAPSDADEHVDGDVAPEALVLTLSHRKAAAAAAGPGDVVVAADTVVALGGAILGKPKNAGDAASMLRALAGRTHTVYTGVCVRKDGRYLSHVEATEVDFRPMTEAEILAYVASGEPMDKAGAYGVQGLGCRFVSGIRGDFYNVMGLPVCALGL
ncbi:MAG TPA: Maf family protein, partial [Oscillospiraceae bacterium]|nr:Maf family protein [Oscillospiraceae bacterium]